MNAPIDLNDPKTLLRDDVLDDPHSFYDLLRKEAPIWQIPGQDTFLISDPNLIKEIVGRTDDFSSNIVSLLHNDGNGCPAALRFSTYRDPSHVFATADPPDHTRQRKLVQPHLSPGAMAELEPAVRAIVDRSLESVLASEQVDIVSTFSDQVPAQTVCSLLGLPDDDVEQVLHFTFATGMLLDGVTDLEGMAQGAAAALELGAFVQTRFDGELAKAPEDRSGLLGVFAGMFEAGEVTMTEVGSMLLVFVTAGSETTASLMATAIETLAEDQELQDRLRRDPSGIPDAIETFLREDGPFQFHYRYVPADTMIGGVAIPAESCVMLMWAAANRPAPSSKEQETAEAEEQRLSPHFAFGRGIHFCIGAPVARMETRIALEQLLASTKLFRLDPANLMTRRPSIFIRRHQTLPLIIERV
ncbi:MAG: cytochrome P450 [Actinobacteria bacterium]|nr:cytochrome P450 [Actinomycetota bacterium]